ncbi:MAG TPA: cytidylate kinase family protein [archaeon]|nr:cytidylate kinase family protein [archaeon]
MLKLLPIFVCGPPVTGKTTLAERISKHYKIKHYNTGDLLKEFAKKYGFAPQGKGWWGTSEGIRFTEMRKKYSSIDKDFDKYIAALARKGNCVLSSWTMPWLYRGRAIKLWITASEKTRAARMVSRDKISFSSAVTKIKKRDKQNYLLYKKTYGIEFGKDLKPFDIILHTDNLPAEKVFEFAVRMIKKRI